MTSAPRLAAELEAVPDDDALAQTAWVVSRLASGHPQPELRLVLAALWEVLRAEADRREAIRADEDQTDGSAPREAAVGLLLDSLHDLPAGFGPKLLEWNVDHLVTRLLRAAWRDHSHHMWGAYQAQDFLVEG